MLRQATFAIILATAPAKIAIAQGGSCPDVQLRTLDLTTRPSSSGVGVFAPVFLDGRAYFPANPLGPGNGLWRTDGTEAGTEEVAPLSHFPAGVSSMLGASGDAVYFFVGSRVWRSNGTLQGTVEVDPSYAQYLMSYGPTFFAGAGPTALYASAGTLWGVKTIDGAPVRVALRPIQNYRLRPPVAFNGRVLFAYWDDDLDASSLYSSDGTVEGTVLLRSWSGANSSSARCEDLYVANNLVFFRAGDGEFGGELWCTDGTPVGTRRLTDIDPGTGNSSGFIEGAAGNKLYFWGYDSNGTTEFGWSDGSAVAFLDGYYGGGLTGRSNNPLRVLDFGGLALFAGGISFNGQTGREPHLTDGTLAGTRLVLDVIPGTDGSAYSQDASGVVIANPGGTGGSPRALFGLRINNSEQLWSTDGTPGNTFYLCDRTTGSGWFLETDGRLAYFPRSSGGMPQLWVSDGTLAGTRPLLDPTSGAARISPGRPVMVGGRMLFNGNDDRYGFEVWSTDGSNEGTRLVRDIGVGTVGSTFAAPVAHGRSALLFSRADGVTAVRAWDGRHAPTTLASSSAGLATTVRRSAVIGERFYVDLAGLIFTSDLSGGPISPLPRSTFQQNAVEFAQVLTPSGPRIVYAGLGVPGDGVEPFISDGTLVGTSQLLDIDPGTASSSPGAFFPLRSRVLFAATNPATGYEWWATDGTPAGTVILADILPGPSSGQRPNSQDQQPTRPTLLKGATPAEDLAYFLGVISNQPNATTYAIYRTDGTPAGTEPVDIGGSGVAPGPPLLAAAGHVFFNGLVSGEGVEIYVTNGAPGATRLLRDFSPGTASTFLDNVFDLGDRALIELYRLSASARELWLFDRADQTLTQVLNGSLGGSNAQDILPGHAVAPNGLVYFGARTQSGHVVARTDGTPEGTCIVARLTAPSTALPSPTVFSHVLTPVGSRIVFLGSDSSVGLEARVIDLCPADHDNSGAVSLQDLFDFLSDWFSTSPASDFNADGSTSLQDLFDFLAAWFAGC